MTETIDLRKKATGEVHPDIAKLIAKCGNIAEAERFAGFSTGYFGKIRRGDSPYSEVVKQRIDAALNDKPIPKEATMPTKQMTLDIPDTCPPLLRDLLAHCGSKVQTAKTLGTSEGTLYGVIGGKPMPPAWIPRAKAQLGQPVIGAPREPAEAPQDQGPVFVPWDGKSKGSFHTRAHGKSKSRTIKNVPQPILDLMTKHQGVVQRASSAVGVTGNTLFKWMEGVAFTEERQRIVHRAMHGLPTGLAKPMGEEFDKYSMGIAIVMLSGASTNFDRINDIADILNGKMVFRKNTKSGWILMYKMAIDDLPKFKKLAMRDASEIVCP